MESLRILNKKETKKILAGLEEHFGSFTLPDYAFLMNNENKAFLISREFGDLDQSKVRINNLGLYFGKVEVDGFRLSLEGAQLIDAKKNVINLEKQQTLSWMRGEDIEVGEAKAEGYVILKLGKDILGCGKLKQGKVINSVPKSRRIIGEMQGEEKNKIRTIRRRR